MALFVLGLVLLAVWPLYNLVLATFMTYDTASGRHGRDASPPTGHEPLVYWIVVPCLNEERVVDNTVRDALALRAPDGAALRVLAVDDGSDDATPLILATIDDPKLRVLRRELPDARRGKGEALNAAYRYIRERAAAEGTDPHRVAVGIIDGDGRGSPNLLTEVALAMRDERVGAAQCRVRIHNRNRLLGAVQDLEFACIVNASQVLRRSLGSVGLGGNGQFTRLSALRRLGDAPWSTCLVEDFELGLRMHLAGVGIRYCSRASVTQQGLVDVRRLVRQRTRWAQGNLQCIRYVPKLWVSPRVRRSALAEIMYYLLAPWCNALGMVGTVALLAYPLWESALRRHSWDTLLVGTAGWTAALVAPFLCWGLVHRVALRDERLTRCLLAGAAYPAFLLLGLVSTCRAVGRQIGRRQSWAKTERLVEEPAALLLREPRAQAESAV